jgi:hypothetical protein
VAYRADDGARLWVRRYDGPATSWYDSDVANAVTVSPDGSAVFVTGDSYRSADDDDYATVAYTALWVLSPTAPSGCSPCRCPIFRSFSI